MLRRKIGPLISFVLCSVAGAGWVQLAQAKDDSSTKFCKPPGITSVVNTPQSELVLPEFKRDGRVFVFFDASTNMRGFVSSASGLSQVSDSNYAKLVHVIPDIVNQVGTSARYHRYRQELSPISGTEISSVTNPSFYVCDENTPTDQCDDPRDQLKQILGIVKGLHDNSLTVITSDFNLSDREVIDTDAGSIRDSIATMFGNGRSFGFYAIKSDFKGIIHGLPGGVPYDQALERPVYVMLIGPIEKIIKFRNVLKKEFSKKLSDQKERFLLFTDKMIKQRITESSFVKKDYSLNKVKWQDIFPGKKIPQFGVPKTGGSVALTVDLNKIQIKETLPLSDYAVTQNIWMERNGKLPCDQRWLRLKKAKNLVEVDPPGKQGNRVSLKFFNKIDAMKKLPTRRRYFLALEIRANSISLSERHEEWLAGWSFNATTFDNLVKKQAGFFPTMNLDRLVKLLTSSSKDAFRGGAILSFHAALVRNR
jgi:hypothetical protein